MKKSTLFTFVFTLFFVLVVYWSVSHRSDTREAGIRIDPNIFLGSSGTTRELDISGPHLSLPTLPIGWYAHRTSDSSYFITKQKDLPGVGAVEGGPFGGFPRRPLYFHMTMPTQTAVVD